MSNEQVIEEVKNIIDKNISASFLGLKPGTEYYTKLEGFQFPSHDRTTYFEINLAPQLRFDDFQRFNNPTLRSIFGVWSPSQGKNFTGDGLIIRPTSDHTVKIALVDGVTSPTPMDESKYGNLITRARNVGAGTDASLPQLIRDFPEILASPVGSELAEELNLSYDEFDRIRSSCTNYRRHGGDSITQQM